MQSVILDTDVVSQLQKRKLAGPLATRLIDRDPIIAFVTLGELTRWAEARRWGARNRQELDLPLATLNLKDFHDFQHHHGLRILGAS